MFDYSNPGNWLAIAAFVGFIVWCIYLVKDRS